MACLLGFPYEAENAIHGGCAAWRRGWRNEPGAAVSAPWAGLFDAPRANDRSDLGAMLSMALFGGSALACLVFAVERVLRLALQQLQRTW